MLTVSRMLLAGLALLATLGLAGCAQPTRPLMDPEALREMYRVPCPRGVPQPCYYPEYGP